MSYRMKQSHATGIGCGTILFVLSLSAIIGGFCWTYTLNTWLAFFNKPAGIHWWQGALLGFVPWLGQASLPAAAITFILMLFL